MIITPVTNHELGSGERPTPPSLLWPGTEEAFRRQCTCPVGENMQRRRVGERPLLVPTCRVHNKVCQAGQAGPCGHSTHLDFHQRCEHCTNVLHTCVLCEAVYLEDGDDPALWGWLYVEGIGALIKGWRCGRCR